MDTGGLMFINIDYNRTNLYQQIYREIMDLIIDRKLVEGDKLPPIRKLAEEHNISINTVKNAYYQLEVEGFISSQPRKGFFVNKIDNLIVLNKDMEEKIEIPSEEYIYDFSLEGVEKKGFPYTIWSRIFKDKFSYDDGILLSKGHPKGYYHLRIEIAKYLNSSRGINVRGEDIIISAGTEQLYYILEDILKEKTLIGFEDPGYAWANPFFFKRHKAIPIKVDQMGIVVEDIIDKKVNLVWTTPGHQFPLGHIMPINRRVDLLNWSVAHKDNYIVEDDYDSEFKYKGRPVPPLNTMDKNDKVIYVGNFSKCLTPALRISYMILPRELMKRYDENFQGFDCACSMIVQKALTDFIKQGYFERHINRMRTIYSKKHSLMKELLEEIEGLDFQDKDSGTSFLINIDKLKSEEAFLKKLRKRKLRIVSVKEYSNIYQGENQFLLGFSKISQEKIKDGLAILGSVIEET